MQTLDARHMELFLIEGYKNGSWDYQEIGYQEINKHIDGTTRGIFDIKHLRDPSAAGLCITYHAMRASTVTIKRQGSR
ncbi:hypothetical protein IFM89_026517 [Coptis chinensis]|uniref:Uncharacterized protein n=1 Tax=Coptis chinensis TaxID=261450 RepID=A0A835IET0_9MAGN|nr:hypothetical protein IFM89_026517 [Coptis chinensis]